MAGLRTAVATWMGASSDCLAASSGHPSDAIWSTRARALSCDKIRTVTRSEPGWRHAGSSPLSICRKQAAYKQATNSNNSTLRAQCHLPTIEYAASNHVLVRFDALTDWRRFAGIGCQLVRSTYSQTLPVAHLVLICCSLRASSRGTL